MPIKDRGKGEIRAQMHFTIDGRNLSSQRPMMKQFRKEVPNDERVFFLLSIMARLSSIADFEWIYFEQSASGKYDTLEGHKTNCATTI